jgi:hypothetical protein
MRFAIALGVAGLALVSPALSAQDRTLSGRGSGSLQLPDGRSIELYQLNFSQSGQAVTFAFLGRNTALPYTLEGQVTGNTAITTLTVELTGGLRDRATRGTARVVFSGADIGSVSADGTMRQGAFRLRFRGESAGGGTIDSDDPVAGGRPFSESASGNGSLEVAGRPYSLNRVRVRLGEDSRAELDFSGERTVTASGTWSRGAAGRVDVSIDRLGSQRTTGTATITFRDRSISRVTANLPRQAMRIEFAAGSAGGPTGSGAEPIDLSMRGQGTYEFQGRRYGLAEMRIRLRSDNTAELRFDGSREAEVKGSWRRRSDGQAEIDVQELNRRRASGRALVSYSGRNVSRVEVNADAQNTRIEFVPEGSMAQPAGGIRPVNVFLAGTGTFRERGRTWELEDASVRLRDNGEAELRFSGERQTGGRGRWTSNGNYATLVVEEWDSRPTRGSGSIAFENGRPQQVTVTLQTEARSISFRFTSQAQPR